MSSLDLLEKKVKALFEELVERQKTLLREVASQHVPTISDDDLLQPNDYPQLENDPLFRYEEGVLAGIQTAQTALNALIKESS